MLELVLELTSGGCVESSSVLSTEDFAVTLRRSDTSGGRDLGVSGVKTTESAVEFVFDLHTKVQSFFCAKFPKHLNKEK